MDYEQFLSAVELLERRGEAVSKESVQALIGGSFTAIQPHLVRWRESGKAPSAYTPPAPDAERLRALQQDMEERLRVKDALDHGEAVLNHLHLFDELGPAAFEWLYRRAPNYQQAAAAMAFPDLSRSMKLLTASLAHVLDVMRRQFASLEGMRDE
jgi:Plasmid replication region DNA-binding N-term